MLNPAPDADTPEIVAFAFPVFMIVTTWLPTVPITFTKFRLVGLADSVAVPAGMGTAGALADWLAAPQPARMPAPARAATLSTMLMLGRDAIRQFGETRGYSTTLTRAKSLTRLTQ
jgi:hypothetical protein